MGITILIKIQTDTQNTNFVSAETTNENHKTNPPECAHYFGYVSSGDRIPEDCLTCSKLLNCLTSKGCTKEGE